MNAKRLVNGVDHYPVQLANKYASTFGATDPVVYQTDAPWWAQAAYVLVAYDQYDHFYLVFACGDGGWNARFIDSHNAKDHDAALRASGFRITRK